MLSFAEIQAKALARKDPDWLKGHLPTVEPAAVLAAKPDHRYLAAMTQVVFSAGFRWRVISAKWEGFEHAFEGIDPDRIASFDEADAERLRQDKRIVRNPQKIKATIANAQYMQSVAAEHGTFASFVANWPDDDIVGLWAALKKDGARLGGATGPRFLRMAGKDTFVLTPDVTYALTEMGVMTAKATSAKGQKQAQEAFSRWAKESGRPMGEISVTLACSVDRPTERP